MDDLYDSSGSEHLTFFFHGVSAVSATQTWHHPARVVFSSPFHFPPARHESKGRVSQKRLTELPMRLIASIRENMGDRMDELGRLQKAPGP